MRRSLVLALPLFLAPAVASCGTDDEVHISSVSPDTGSARGGEEVVVSGSGFAADSRVVFGGSAAPLVEVQSPESLLVTTPMLLAGRTDLTVENPGGPSDTLPGGFSFLPLELQFLDAPEWYLPALESLDVSDAVAADFDGDGDTDILVALRYGEARLLLNSGNGSFTGEPVGQTDAGAPDASPDATPDASADASSDAADDDAADPDGGAPEGGWPSGPDAGADTGGSNPPAPTKTWVAATNSLLVSDFDADGDSDVFLCNGWGQSAQLMLNDGKGEFTLAQGAFPATTDHCLHAALADVNGDGRDDIIAAAYGPAVRSPDFYYLRVLLRGSDPQVPSFSVAGDLETPADVEGGGCGVLEISGHVTSMAATLAQDDAAGGETSCKVTYDQTEGPSLLEVQVGCGSLSEPDAIELDVRSDGKGGSLEVLLLDSEDELFTFDAGALSGTGWKHIRGERSAWKGKGVGGNGIVDGPVKIITRFETSTAAGKGSFWFDNLALEVPGFGTFLCDDYERADFAVAWPTRIDSVASGDLDGDGDIDLVATGNDHESPPPYLHLVRNESGPGTTPSLILRREPSAVFSALVNHIASAVVFDADGDSDLDVVAAAGGCGSIEGANCGQDRLLVNDGQGHFFDDTLASMPLDRSDGSSVAIDDLDMDGLPDLLIANDGAVNRIYVNRAGRGFLDSTPALPLRETRTLKLVPLDAEGDGDRDLFVLNRKGEASSLYVSVAPPGAHAGVGK